MKLKIYIVILILTALATHTRAQVATYTVTKAPFSSDKYDEFSPVYYNNGIVFCMNRNPNPMVSYAGAQGSKGQFKIYYIDTTEKVTPGRAKLFSKSLKTNFNDGPATFNAGGDTIYYSRNLRTEGRLSELSNSSNKLGLFSAVYTGKNKWTRIREMRFNSEWYNISTPCLSHDRRRIYFASDKPNGYGGSDLYYSDLKNGYWGDPVNLGSQVNTAGNESYPFISEAGELFFSSDGHPGLGGKDIFVTRQTGSVWLQPVRLEAPVNSEYDDFGIITDPLLNEGYFSSDRGKSIDIYRFKSGLSHFWFTESQKDNQYCFTVSDEGSIEVDTLRLQYVWDFGDGSTGHGRSVSHCYPGTGIYNIKLDLIDKRTGKLFFNMLSYKIEISENDQPFIDSPDVAVAGETIEFDGLKSFCPGYTITDYYWNFGDGTSTNGERISHKFAESGEYIVRLGLTLKSGTTGNLSKRAVEKKINVLSNEKERDSYLAGSYVARQNLLELRKIENIKIRDHFSVGEEFMGEAMFQLLLFSSPERIPLSSAIFRKVPAKYTMREIFDQKTKQYSYIVDRQMSLMAAYPAYSDLIAAGYPDTRAGICTLQEPAEKELYNIRKNYSLLADANFDAAGRMTTSSYVLLDQIVTLMNKYPAIRLEISVHTDNQGVAANNLAISQLRAQVLVNHLISRGISARRLVLKGYGGIRPVAPNNLPADRRTNRRIEFTILSD